MNDDRNWNEDEILATTHDRREFLTLGVGLLFVATVPILGRRSRAELVRRSAPCMGTTAEIVVAHRDRAQARIAIDAALRELQWVERTMTRFRPDSDVGRANAFAAESAVEVSLATGRVLERSLYWADQTGGRFDPCLGRVTSLWDVGLRTTPLDAAAYQRFRGAELHRHLEVVDASDCARVSFRSADVSLDLGGIAKGFGVDRAVAVLREYGVRDALVGVGGDLCAMGLRPGGDPWRIGVRSADDPKRLAVQLEASDLAVATSGDYEQYFEHAGRRYHHIMDPATAEPVVGPRHSMTIGAPDCMAADAVATALFGAGREEADALLCHCSGLGLHMLHHIPVTDPQG